jgi:TetR/AcrR family transcriptional regulator
MQEIANQAGVNKSLLYYHFKSKELLFEMIFENSVRQLIPVLFNVLGSNKSLFEKIQNFFETHIGFLQTNPFLLNFIMYEINKNPVKVIKVFEEHVNHIPNKFELQVIEEMKKGNILEIKPFQLILNMLSLSVFPFAAKPLVEYILTKHYDSEYDIFLEERKKSLPEFVINSIKKK